MHTSKSVFSLVKTCVNFRQPKASIQDLQSAELILHNQQKPFSMQVHLATLKLLDWSQKYQGNAKI